MLSLYLHIPFCRQKCAYCAFYSAPAKRDLCTRYAHTLERAVRHFGQAEGRPLATLYFGGGTPALLGGEHLTRLILQSRASFGFEDQMEITVELNPESTDPSLLQALHQAGVNRVSLGVQSLCDRELARLGRLHTRQKALQALRDIFEAGFCNVSADVMYGLPGQTAESFEDTLDTLLAFPLTHLSAYSLQLEEGTPLFRQGVRPMAEEREETLYRLLCEKAGQAGFLHYEISNFARHGQVSRHNFAYWRRTDYLGLGPAAHSFLRGVRYHYEADTEKFLLHPLQLRNSEKIGPEEAWYEQVMLGLRTSEGIPLSLLPAGLALSRYRDFSIIKDGRFCLNERGFYLSNAIIAEILAKEQTK